jgi:hypothetical protein
MPTVSELRDAIDHLHALAAGDLHTMWRRVRTAEQARAALQDLLPLLIATYGSAAATIAADWYDELRDDLSVKRRFAAIVAEIDDAGSDVLARWGIGPLFDNEPDWRRARVLIDGGLQLRIANAARETIRVSSLEDPAAQGWQRSSSGGCAFCAMVAGRGVVYSEASADFASHDHCRCVAVPAFSGKPRLVRPYAPSERVASDADRARVSAWIDDNVDA